MELLLGLAIVIAVCAALAFIIREILKIVGKRRGYTPEQLPKHYHIIGVCAYFSVFWLLLFVLHFYLNS